MEVLYFLVFFIFAQLTLRGLGITKQRRMLIEHGFAEFDGRREKEYVDAAANSKKKAIFLYFLYFLFFRSN